ncbi:glutaminyl-peptide cyclotransferase, partial [Rudaea sp.]|uniref:glutaminyl-peptide cyclotransferase n=1 Tax=Rudaea sp. TaxID=2136325 RepID=UPI002ED60234
MKKLVFVLASALPGLSALAALAAPVASTADIPVYSYEVVHVYPHDRGAFTEGLFFRDGFLFESTGMNGASSIRKVELKSGRVVQQHDLPQAFFGEGIVDWKNKLIAVTWRTQHGFVLDIDDLNKVEKEFFYPGEGWGMTRNDKSLLLSDGT